jgi:hypothetical protein
VRAVNPARVEIRVAIDARNGRVLSAMRVAHQPPAPADLPLEGRAMPPGQMPDAPAPKLENAPSPGPAKPVMVPIAPLE